MSGHEGYTRKKKLYPQMKAKTGSKDQRIKYYRSFFVSGSVDRDELEVSPLSGVAVRSWTGRSCATNTGDSVAADKLVSLAVLECAKSPACDSDGVTLPDRDAVASASSLRSASSSRSNL